MTLQQQLEADYKEAFRTSKRDIVETLRFVKAQLKNAEIAKRGELDEAEFLAVVQRDAKRRQDSITQFANGNRPDLVQQEQLQLAIVSKYLPAQLTDADLNVMVQAVIAEVKPAGPQDMGKVMGLVMKKVGSGADGNRVRTFVTAALQQ